MAIKKFISVAVIFNSIMGKFKPGNSNWINDGIEWTGQAIQGIGYHVGFETTYSCNIEVKSHFAAYPCGFERLIAVTKDCKVLRKGSDLSGYGMIDIHKIEQSTSTITNDGPLFNLTQLYDEQVALYNAAVAAGEPIEVITELREAYEDTLRKINSTIEFNSKKTLSADIEYYAEERNCIKTSFDCGIIRMLYVTYPLDINGFPMIVDDYNYKTAIEWYIVRNLLLGGLKHTVIDFAYADAMWEKYRLIAGNSVRMPSIADIERFMTMWTGVRQYPVEYDRLFIGVEQPVFETR